jgi:hypothetical protein
MELNSCDEDAYQNTKFSAPCIPFRPAPENEKGSTEALPFLKPVVRFNYFPYM